MDFNFLRIKQKIFLILVFISQTVLANKFNEYDILVKEKGTKEERVDYKNDNLTWYVTAKVNSKTIKIEATNKDTVKLDDLFTCDSSYEWENQGSDSILGKGKFFKVLYCKYNSNGKSFDLHSFCDTSPGESWGKTEHLEKTGKRGSSEDGIALDCAIDSLYKCSLKIKNECKEKGNIAYENRKYGISKSLYSASCLILNEPSGCYNLGELYSREYGDIEKSKKYHQIGCRLGDSDSCTLLKNPQRKISKISLEESHKDKNAESFLPSLESGKHQEYCKDYWTKKGKLDQGMYIYCLNQEKDGYEELKILEKKYRHLSWLKDGMSFRIKEWTKNGSRQDKMVLYNLKQDIDGFEEMESKKKDPVYNNVKANACFKKWYPQYQMIYYCYKTGN